MRHESCRMMHVQAYLNPTEGETFTNTMVNGTSIQYFSHDVVLHEFAAVVKITVCAVEANGRSRSIASSQVRNHTSPCMLSCLQLDGPVIPQNGMICWVCDRQISGTKVPEVPNNCCCTIQGTSGSPMLHTVALFLMQESCFHGSH